MYACTSVHVFVDITYQEDSLIRWHMFLQFRFQVPGIERHAHDALS